MRTRSCRRYSASMKSWYSNVGWSISIDKFLSLTLSEYITIIILLNKRNLYETVNKSPRLVIFYIINFEKIIDI